MVFIPNRVPIPFYKAAGAALMVRGNFWRKILLFEGNMESKNFGLIFSLLEPRRSISGVLPPGAPTLILNVGRQRVSWSIRRKPLLPNNSHFIP